MSEPQLPTEMLDCITDFLHDNRDALKTCCLVSISWVPRTRKHLFKCVNFKYSGDFDKWKRNFPNPVKSPAIHTRSLFFRYADRLSDADVGWIRSFTNVVQLEMVACGILDYNRRLLSPFHGLSSTVKSLSVVWTDLKSQEVFDLICSFPHLVDLHVAGEGRIRNSGRDWTISRLPPLTGSIVLGTLTPDFARQLLKLANHLRFKKIMLQKMLKNSFEGVADLAERCCDVLECIEIDTFSSTSAKSFPPTAISSASICRTPD